jgi:hypothetical protein
MTNQVKYIILTPHLLRQFIKKDPLF